MFSITVNDKEYKVRFSYGVLRKTDLIERVISIDEEMQANPKLALQKLMQTNAELLLAGLQKRHAEEFGYETETEKEAALDKIDNLIDDYEDESTEENPKDCYVLFKELQNELMKNGFLSILANAAADEVATDQDATVVPQDHKKKAS